MPNAGNSQFLGCTSRWLFRKARQILHLTYREEAGAGHRKLYSFSSTRSYSLFQAGFAHTRTFGLLDDH